MWENNKIIIGNIKPHCLLKEACTIIPAENVI